MHAKILVVEDEAITALDIQGLLERMGFEVVSIASNGREAIQKAKDLKPDLILMDITLKGEMDGIEAADEIMNLFNIPVIYLTGYSDEKTFERIKLTKPYGFISKPVSPNELKASIDTALYKYDLDKKLKESEEKYRQWFEDDLTGNFIATHEGKLFECNSAFLEIYGFVNREKAIHSNISKFNFAGWINLIATLKKEHKIKNYETWHKRPDGKRIYVVANVVGIFNDSNELIQVKGYVLDDTERKKAEENFHKEVKRESFLLELYKSAPQLTDKELYECALNHAVCLTDSNIGFFHLISDDQKNIILNTWNSEALRTCKTSFKTHYPVEQAGNWTDCIQAKGPVVYNDFKNSPNRKGFPEGHVSVKRFISIPVFDEDKAKFIFGVGNKIEEYDAHDVLQIQSVANELYKIIKQRHWEQALKEAHDNLEKKVEERTSELENAYDIVKESETKFRELFNQATDMLSLTELNEDSTIKRYIEVNEAASKRLGYNKDELLNITPLDIYLDSRSLLDMIDELFEKGYSTAENIQVAKGGRQIPVELYTTLFKLRGKNIVLSISRDITERNKVEKKLKETVKELERSNEELRQFAYVSSHDLQEPLRTIASFTQLLERRYKGKLDRDADEFMDYIVDAAVRMKQQINDLLEYSRVTTAGNEFRSVDTNSILNQAVNNLKNSIDDTNAEIIHDPLPDVIADGDQLRRVFQNIIGNAIKYRKPDEVPKIYISAYKDEKNNEYIFSIQDKGIGIDNQYLDKIFKIFQRLHTIGEYQGTGIGLSVVERVIERHKGRIWVESELNKGSTFYFTIPIKDIQDREQ